jgi:2-polyprenyl-6-methoxyphenol hydroxylase-like FAD-dependent oxidoreductase
VSVAPMPEVLVVGAGPVGLTMAAEFARHGQRCRIIDRLDAPSGFCKAIGVTPRTLEVWDDMGIAQPMIDAGLWLEGLRMIIPGQPPNDVISDLSDLPYGNLGIPQYETERILAEHLGRIGVDVERGVALNGLSDDGRRVHVELGHAGGRIERAQFRYVVGCDGAHSVVRKAAGIGFPGDQFPVEFMLGDVVIDWDVPRGFAVFAIRPNEDGPPDFFVAIPLPERKRYRVSMLAPREPAEADDAHGILSERPGPSLDELQAVADRLLPAVPQISDLRWSSLFRISMRLADEYRAGNAFIAGDAAHIHPPTGGQGMNTGIQDAYNLAWKMALVLRGAAAERLLDSYEAERRPVGAEVVARTRAESEGLGRTKRGPDDRLKDTQILVNYRDSEGVEDAAEETATDDAPRAGDRAPDAEGLRRGHVGFPLRLFDVLRGSEHVLVLYLGEQAEHYADEVAALGSTATADGLIRTVAIVTPGSAAIDLGVPLLRDMQSAFVRCYRAKVGMMWLIRPDGYIGLRSAALDRAVLERFVQRTVGIDLFEPVTPPEARPCVPARDAW